MHQALKVKANVALDIGQSVIERHQLAPSDEVAQAVLDDIVREIVDVGEAWTKDAGTNQRAKKDSIYAAGLGDGRYPRLP